MRKLFGSRLILLCGFNTFKKYGHELISLIECFINFITNDDWLPFNDFQVYP